MNKQLDVKVKETDKMNWIGESYTPDWENSKEYQATILQFCAFSDNEGGGVMAVMIRHNSGQIIARDITLTGIEITIMS